MEITREQVIGKRERERIIEREKKQVYKEEKRERHKVPEHHSMSCWYWI